MEMLVISVLERLDRTACCQEMLHVLKNKGVQKQRKLWRQNMSSYASGPMGCGYSVIGGGLAFLNFVKLV